MPEEAGKNKQTEEVLENLLTVMTRGGIHHHITGNTVETALKSAVKCIPELSNPVKMDLYEGLIEREHLNSTGIGKGVAIPHPRTPLADGLDRPIITTCFLDKPIEFDAIDDRPVFVLFILLSPSVKTHLHLLSRISYCVRDDSFMQFLKAYPLPGKLFSKISEFEEYLDTSDRL